MAQFTLDGVTYSKFRDIPGAVYTRSGVEYQQNAAGVWTPFDDDTPPVSAGVGVDVWEARTNSIRNPTGLGAVAGTPGTLPTNWSISGTDPTTIGLTRTLSAGVENGLPYLEINLVGTPTVTYATGTYFELGTQIAASSGQTWTAALFAKVIGTPVGVSFLLNIVGRSSGGSGTETFSSTPSLTSTLLPFSASALLANASTAFIHFALGITVTSGVPVNVTYRVYAPNLKLGSNIGDPPILQTTNAAATRGAPSMYLNAPGLLNAPFTVQVWAQLPALDGVTRRLLDIDDGSGNNRVAIIRSNANNGAVVEWASGVNATGTDFPGKTGSRVLKIAVRIRATSYRAACDNILGTEISTSAIQQMNRIVFGNTLIGATAYLNGAITRFQIINRDLTDAELVALTA